MDRLAKCAALVALISAIAACGSCGGRAANAYTFDHPPAGSSVRNVSRDGKTVTLSIEHATCESVALDNVGENTNVVTVRIRRTAYPSSPGLFCDAALRIAAVTVRLRSPLDGRHLKIAYN